MELYTTAFTWPPLPVPPTPPAHPNTFTNQSTPSLSPQTRSTSPSVSPQPQFYTPPTASPQPADDASTLGSPTVPVPSTSEADWEAVQRLCLEVGAREGCIVTVTRDYGTDTEGQAGQGKGRGMSWNFMITGNYNAVMSARGVIMRDCKQNYRAAIKAPRRTLLQSTQLKPEVRKRLDEIALSSRAHIAVVNLEPSSGGDGQGGPSQEEGSKEHGLQEELGCELIVTGQKESVEIAKVWLLVMLDELNGLTATFLEMDFKYHLIASDRKRVALQLIEEETSTNIYLPSLLVGTHLPPGPTVHEQQLLAHGIDPARFGMGMGMVGNPAGPYRSPQMLLPSQVMAPRGGGMGMPGFGSPEIGQPQPQQQGFLGAGLEINRGPSPALSTISQRSLPGSFTGGGGGSSQHSGAATPSHSPNPTGPYVPPQYRAQQQAQAAMAQYPGGAMNAQMYSDTMLARQQASLALMQQVEKGKHNLIVITGDWDKVVQAKDMLVQVANFKTRTLFTKEVLIVPRKIDWMLACKKEEIKKIMVDNGTYIQMPLLGSQNGVVTVFGSQAATVERSVKQVCEMTCERYVGCIWLIPANYEMLVPAMQLRLSQYQEALKWISHATGTEMVFKTNNFEIHGTKDGVRRAMHLLLEQDFVKNFHHEIRFQIELANDQQDFISGKKNGKILRIQKTANVRIKFENFNETNFMIEVSGNDGGVFTGLSLLQDEMPAELSFHVPETQHKKIIGIAGKNIQTCMRKYGVYVKFSNADEWMKLGGYQENDDNVIARTPGKNVNSLQPLKGAIMEQLPPEERDYKTKAVYIPRQLHRNLIVDHGKTLKELQDDTKTDFRWPSRESARDCIFVTGPEMQIVAAINALNELVPFEANLRVPYSARLLTLIGTPEFEAVKERIEAEFRVTVEPREPPVGIEDFEFRFRCRRNVVGVLGAAREVLDDFLVVNEIPMYPEKAMPSRDSGLGGMMPAAYAPLEGGPGRAGNEFQDAGNANSPTNGKPVSPQRPGHENDPFWPPMPSSPQEKAPQPIGGNRTRASSARTQSLDITSLGTLSRFGTRGRSNDLSVPQPSSAAPTSPFFPVNRHQRTQSSNANDYGEDDMVRAEQ